MRPIAPLVRCIRSATDPIAPFSFNRMGFAFNRQSFSHHDLPGNAKGRIALVTGANSGIGRATAIQLAQQGCNVWLLCRDEARGLEAREAIARECTEDRVHLAVVNMSSLTSIRCFVRDFSPSRVDILIHNAGVLPHARILTEDSVELTFATNVLGPFALTGLLLHKLRCSDDARVIFVASGGLYLQRFDCSMFVTQAESFNGMRAYANAKRAQVILTHILADKISSKWPITFASMHPGWADTKAIRTSLPKFHAMMRHFLRSPEQGSDTVVWLATSDHPKGTLGEFWFDRRVVPEYPLPWTRESPNARQELLSLCETLSGVSMAIE